MELTLHPFVSVIVPVFNDCSRLAICLVALQRQSYPKDRMEIVVVDNGLNQGIELLAKQYSSVVFLKEAKPGSYAARNTGVAHARGEIIAFTDADCIPASNWVAKGVERILRTPNCGLVGGKIEVFFYADNHPNIIEYYDSVAYLDQERLMRNSRGASTANLFTRSQIFKDVGLFNDIFYSGGDVRWGRRVLAAGYQQVYAPEVEVRHPARSSALALYLRVARQIDSGMLLFSATRKPFIGFHPDLFIEELMAQFKSGNRGFRNLVYYLLGVVFVFLIKIFELLRLLFGGKPQR